MPEQSPNTTNTVGPSGETAARRKRWRRFAWLMLLAQSTLFWHGCGGGYVHLSLGLGGPWAMIGYDDPPATVKLLDFSPMLLIVNVLLVAVTVWLVARLSPRWLERCTSGYLLTAAAIATLIFNSVLYFGGIWINLVAIPISWLCDGLFGRMPEGPALVIGVVSRAYFLVGVALIAGVLALVQWLSRRWLFVHSDRWQVSLGGLLALMALLGTGVGILLRLFS